VVDSGRLDAARDDDGQGPVIGAGESDERRWAWLTLDPSPRSVPAARAWVRDLAETWELGDLDWTLMQLLTELVTNSVLHARTPVLVRLEQETATGAVRCEVTDYSPGRPRRRAHTAEATTGRGLQMLEQLSSSWGVDSTPAGKSVWFELRNGAGGQLGDDYWEALADLDMSAPAVDPPAASPTVLKVVSRQWVPFLHPSASEGIAA
jgi:anti-sigma regulatory factor (Ser/Thr protein kinase)